MQDDHPLDSATNADSKQGLPAFLSILWQEVDQILYYLQEDALRDAELAHLGTIPSLDPSYHYQMRASPDSLTPANLAKKMIKEVINYRQMHNPYYQAPQADFLRNRNQQSRSFWLGWGC